jgi:ClpP class serine protease
MARPKLADDPELFTGAFWTGMKGLELGLVDGIGELRTVLHQRFGKDMPIRMLGERRGFFRRRLGIGAGPGSAAGLAAASVDAIMATIEERALWGRFGL